MELRKPAAGLYTAALAVAALAVASPSGAMDINGFMPERGHGDAALSYTSETYDEFWVGKTKVPVPNGGKVDTKSTALWVQWGLTGDLALVANLPYVDVKSDGFGLKDSGLQDLSVLLKRG